MLKMPRIMTIINFPAELLTSTNLNGALVRFLVFLFVLLHKLHFKWIDFNFNRRTLHGSPSDSSARGDVLTLLNEGQMLPVRRL